MADSDGCRISDTSRCLGHLDVVKPQWLNLRWVTHLETCFLAEVFLLRVFTFFFFSSTIFFLLDQWLFGLLAFAFVARVHLFVHPLFSLYTSIWLRHMKVWGGVTVYM